MPDNKENRPVKAASVIAADDDGFTVTRIPTSIGEILSDLFDRAVTAYHAAIDSERWGLVWSLGELIEAIDRISDPEVD